MPVILNEVARKIVPLCCHTWVRHHVRPWLHYGRGVRCVCCGGRFRAFLPLRSPGVFRANVRCPRCESRERHRLLWLYLQARTNLFTEHLRLLHVAPEEAIARPLAALPNLTYVTADRYRGRPMVKLDLTQLPFPDDAFDAILCYQVLQCVSDDRQAMRELRRVLRPDGWALLQSHTDSDREQTLEAPESMTAEERNRILGSSHSLRVYGRDYRDRLEAAGFHVTLDGYVRHLPEEQIRTNGLDPVEDIFRCTK